jgi:hypothetical protein
LALMAEVPEVAQGKVWDLSPRLRVERLQAVAQFIEAIPDDQFYMAAWWLDDGVEWDSDRNISKRVRPGACGCAAGHLVNAGWCGLTQDALKTGDGGGYLTPAMARQAVFSRLGDAFGIGHTQAAFVFDHYAYSVTPITQAAVARRLRFLAQELVESIEAKRRSKRAPVNEIA